MSTYLYMPPPCFDHDPGAGHPESADRLRAIDDVLSTEAFAFLIRVLSGPANREQIERAHESAYVSAILARQGCSGYVDLGEDTVISSGSVTAALYAAGAACQAIDDVLAGAAHNAFCAIRPPGHHAEADRAMGFCLFNNIAIAALQARSVHQVKRIAIIDFDAHHGNGIQSIFQDDRDILYISLHEADAYPQTGHPHESGNHNNIVNIPLPGGAGSDLLRQVWQDTIATQLLAFDPDLVLIAAGFDAHRGDAISRLRFTTQDYGWLTEQIVKTANQTCRGRVVSVLEGGYELPFLAAAVARHVTVLMEV